MGLPDAIINMIHNNPEQCIISGIIFLVGVWITAIIHIIRNNRKRLKEKERKKFN